MKYIKTYESVFIPNPGDPQIGDYVICIDKTTDDERLVNFINTHIGKIVISDRPMQEYDYIVQYDNIPEIFICHEFDFNDHTARPMYKDEILYFSPDKKEMEIILQQNKYNL